MALGDTRRAREHLGDPTRARETLGTPPRSRETRRARAFRTFPFSPTARATQRGDPERSEFSERSPFGNTSVPRCSCSSVRSRCSVLGDGGTLGGVPLRDPVVAPGEAALRRQSLDPGGHLVTDSAQCARPRGAREPPLRTPGLSLCFSRPPEVLTPGPGFRITHHVLWDPGARARSPSTGT